MKTLLHIVATPRAGESRTLKVSDAFLESFLEKNQDYAVDITDIVTMVDWILFIP